jgi:hypothetical protein
VWPENWPAVHAFLLVRTQWRTGAGGATGLDYPAVWLTLRIYQVQDRAAVFGDLRVMEGAILQAWGEQIERGRR